MTQLNNNIYTWSAAQVDYRTYLVLERAMASNSTEAYMRDFRKFATFFESVSLDPVMVSMRDIESFMASLFDSGLSDASRARVLSGLRNFYGFLLHTDRVSNSPTDLLSSPIVRRKLPKTLSYDDVLRILTSIDLSDELGHRNRAILEVLYSCGVRVSELVGMRLADVFISDQVVRVRGKGNKERLTPISHEALKFLKLYMGQREHMTIERGCSDILFLNRNGGQLTRVMVFYIVRDAARAAGIPFDVHPHMLRHSFASHMVNNGADIRIVQEMLGHESITTTEIYTHLDASVLRNAVELLEPENEALQDR